MWIKWFFSGKIVILITWQWDTCDIIVKVNLQSFLLLTLIYGLWNKNKKLSITYKNKLNNNFKITPLFSFEICNGYYFSKMCIPSYDF